AHTPNHRTMPPHQSCQSRLFATAEVDVQELPIGQPRLFPQKHRPAEMLDHVTHLAGRHVVSLVRPSVALYLTTTRSRPFDALLLLEGRGRLTSRCSRRGRHHGFPRGEVSSAGPAAELGRSAWEATAVSDVEARFWELCDRATRHDDAYRLKLGD